MRGLRGLPRGRRLLPIGLFLVVFSACGIASAHDIPAFECAPRPQANGIDPNLLVINLYETNHLQGTNAASGAMVQILQSADSAIAEAGNKGTDCQKAAANIAFQAVFDAYTGGILGGFLKAIKSALTNIFGLGKEGLEEYLGGKLDEAEEAAKEAFKEWVKEKLKGNPPETFTTEFTKGPCTGTVTSTWDMAAGTYKVVVKGECACNPVPTGGVRSAQLKEFTVTVDGKVSIDLDYKEHMPILHVDPNPKVTIQADCESCSQRKATKQAEKAGTPPPPGTTGGGGGTISQPPPVPELPKECEIKPPCPECLSIYNEIVALCNKSKGLISELRDIAGQWGGLQNRIAYAQRQFDQLNDQHAPESQIAAQKAELTALQQEAKNLILTALNDGIELQKLQATLADLAKQLAECNKPPCGPKNVVGQPPTGTTPPPEKPKQPTPPVEGGGAVPPQGPSVPPPPPLPPRTPPQQSPSAPIVPREPLPKCLPAGIDPKAACQRWLNIAQQNQLAANLAAEALASAEYELGVLTKAAQSWADHAKALQAASDEYRKMSQDDAAKAASAPNPQSAATWQQFSQDAAQQSRTLDAQARDAQAQADTLSTQAKAWADKVAAAKADLAAKQAAAAISKQDYDNCLKLPTCPQPGQTVPTQPTGGCAGAGCTPMTPCTGPGCPSVSCAELNCPTTKPTPCTGPDCPTGSCPGAGCSTTATKPCIPSSVNSCGPATICQPGQTCESQAPATPCQPIQTCVTTAPSTCIPTANKPCNQWAPPMQCQPPETCAATANGAGPQGGAAGNTVSLPATNLQQTPQAERIAGNLNCPLCSDEKRDYETAEAEVNRLEFEFQHGGIRERLNWANSVRAENPAAYQAAEEAESQLLDQIEAAKIARDAALALYRDCAARKCNLSVSALGAIVDTTGPGTAGLGKPNPGEADSAGVANSPIDLNCPLCPDEKRRYEAAEAEVNRLEFEFQHGGIQERLNWANSVRAENPAAYQAAEEAESQLLDQIEAAKIARDAALALYRDCAARKCANTSTLTAGGKPIMGLPGGSPTLPPNENIPNPFGLGGPAGFIPGTGTYNVTSNSVYPSGSHLLSAPVAKKIQFQAADGTRFEITLPDIPDQPAPEPMAPSNPGSSLRLPKSEGNIQLYGSSLQLAAFHPNDTLESLPSGTLVQMISRPRPARRPTAEGNPQAAVAPEFNLIANGNASGEAFEFQMFDPTGKLKEIRVPDGLILEPIERGTVKPVSAKPGERKSSHKLSAYCVNYDKDAPESNGFYRIAAPEIQEQYKPVRAVIRTGRELAAAGRFHPDSDPEAYIISIRQYALWTRLENWNEEKFGEVFREKTKQIAEQSKVEWTKEMDQALSVLIPGRWRDISLVLDEARKLEAGPAVPAR